MRDVSIANGTQVIDLTAAKRFFDLMAEGEAVTFQTFGDQDKSPRLARIIHGTIDERAAELAQLNRDRAGVFFMVNFGDGKGRSATNVTGVRSLFVDLDGAPLAPVYEAGLSPHVIVESSFGRFHAYWNVADCPKEKFGALQKALAQRFNGDPVVHDLPRVMRVPGFYHLKAEPFQTRVIESHSIQPYRLAEIVEKLKLRDAYSSTQRKNRSKVNENSLIFPEGRRNAGLLGLAGTMRRQGMAAASIEIALLAENRIRCSPPLADNEVRQIALNCAKYAPTTTTARTIPHQNQDVWPIPILPGAFAPPAIEGDILPGWVGAMVTATAKSTQTPPAMAAMFALSVLATALQGRFEISPRRNDDGYTEPLPIWAVTILGPGNLKSAVKKAMVECLEVAEKKLQDRLRPEINRRRAIIDIATKRIEKLKTDASRADNSEERQRLQTEVEAELAGLPREIFPPVLMVKDVTPERLQAQLVEQDGRMSVIADEGGFFKVMAGLYSGGKANIDVLVDAQSGSSMRVERAARSAYLPRTALTIGIAMQEGVLQEMGKNTQFRSIGVLARFLYVLPESPVGKRDVRANNPIPQSIRDSWNSGIGALLDSAPMPLGTPHVLRFSPEAEELWLDFKQYIESNQGVGARWAAFTEWTSKLSGTVARIATLLEIAIRGVDVTDVGIGSVSRSITLGHLLIEHAEAAFRLMGTDDAEADAVAVLRWIERNRLSEFTRREAQKALESRFRTVSRLLAAIRQLQEWYVLSPERKRQSDGGRPSIYYAVNPHTFVDKS